MAGSSRQKLIDAACRRFYRDGFRNVGIDQILADVGISKTAFYKHFTCKDDLMIEVLRQHDDWFREVFAGMVRDRGGPCAVGQLRAVFDVVDMVIREEGFHGCIFVNAAMEFPLPHDPVHGLAVANKQAIERIVADIARSAGVAEAERLASELCLIAEGAYVTFTVTHDPATIDIARGIADTVIDRHLAAADRRQPAASSKRAR